MSQPFPEASFSYLAENEERHWWFRSRNEIILWTLRAKARLTGAYLEVGCGSGFVLYGVSKCFPSVRLDATEYYESALVYAKSRVPSCSYRQLDAAVMKDVEAYECIGCFDVLEHIELDTKVLSNFHRALRTGGYLLLTVPQHPWLWSAADSYAHHVRRYTASELRNKVVHSGFAIRYCSSFVSLLLPLMAVQRLLARNKPYNPDGEFQIGSLLNSCLYLVMQLEHALLRLGLRLPAGGSLLLLAQKL